MNKKKKLISALTALTLLTSSTTSALAASSRYHNSQYTASTGVFYVDDNGFKVMDDYVIDPNNRKIYGGYSFDYRDNVILNNPIYENYNNYDNYYNEYRDYYNNYNDYNNYNKEHVVNVDISDPEVYARYMQAHRETCNDYYCRYNNQYPQNYNNANNYDYYNTNQNNYEDTQFYVLVKTENGITKYAYSPVADISEYGIYGWALNSIYNENDFDLNSVFFEEINTFGNDYRWNSDIVNKINNIHNLFIWRYETYEGTKYCVSKVRIPQNPDFVFNSEFNINDIGVLKTSYAVMNQMAYNRLLR